LVEKSLGMRRTEELAVMWDTFKPLRMTTLAGELDDGEYAYSWRDEAPSPVAESTTG
jgi:homogentisate 1,2-dioxygenase